MQLILTQTDIETALINYVNDLVNIKEGMVITVDLKATRGADGATAIIDISPVKAATAKAEPVKATAAKPAAQTRTVEVAKTEIVKDTKPVVEAQAEQAAEAGAETQASETQAVQVNNTDDEPEAGATVGGTEAGEAQVEEPAAGGGEPVVEEEAAAPVKPQSLFAGLRKPKND